MYELYPGEPDENKIYLDPGFREELVQAHYPDDIVYTLVQYNLLGAVEVVFGDEGDLAEATHPLVPSDIVADISDSELEEYGL